MQEQENTNNPQTETTGNTNLSKFKALKRRITIVLIVAISAGMLVCACLIIQAHITQRPAIQIFEYSSFKPDFKLLGYSSLMFLIAGYLLLILAAAIYAIDDIKQKQLSYIPGFISGVFMLLSFGLWFISHNIGSEWWSHFAIAFIGINIIITTFSTLVNPEQKQLRRLLELIKYALALAILILIFFHDHN